MKILVTGYSGQLGFDVVKYGLKLGLNMLGVGSQDLILETRKKFHISLII